MWDVIKNCEKKIVTLSMLYFFSAKEKKYNLSSDWTGGLQLSLHQVCSSLFIALITKVVISELDQQHYSQQYLCYGPYVYLHLRSKGHLFEDCNVTSWPEKTNGLKVLPQTTSSHSHLCYPALTWLQWSRWCHIPTGLKACTSQML